MKHSSSQAYQGTCVVPGVAEGILRFFHPSWSVAQDEPPQYVGDPEIEVGRYHREAASLGSDLHEAAKQLDADALPREADIVRRHAQLLDDGELTREIEQVIRLGFTKASVAAGRILRSRARSFEQSQFPGLADRAAEFDDLAVQLGRRLTDRAAEARIEEGGRDVVWAAKELLPSLVLEADRKSVV